MFIIVNYNKYAKTFNDTETDHDQLLSTGIQNCHKYIGWLNIHKQNDNDETIVNILY